MADDRAPDTARPADASPTASSFTLDLSTGKPGKTRRKGFVPVVQQTINLSTPKPPMPKPAAEAPAEPRPSSGGPKRSRDDRQRDRRPSGNSLADLLDPETLAKLRGE